MSDDHRTFWCTLYDEAWRAQIAIADSPSAGATRIRDDVAETAEIVKIVKASTRIQISLAHKRTRRGAKLFDRAVCTVTDKPVQGFSRASAPCLSHCRLEAWKDRCAHAMT